MEPSYSLEYYRKVFGTDTPGFDEVLDALAEELEDYAVAVVLAAASGDQEALTRLRHTHRPLVRNLRLVGLQALEADLQSGRLEAAPSLAEEARTVALALTSGRKPDGPRPR